MKFPSYVCKNLRFPDGKRTAGKRKGNKRVS